MQYKADYNNRYKFMETIFGKKIKKILEIENITIKDFAEQTDMLWRRVYDFTRYRVKNPTLDSVQKIINGYPEYASYLLDINTKKLPKQKEP